MLRTLINKSATHLKVLFTVQRFSETVFFGSGIEVFSLTKMFSARSVCKLRRSKTCKSVEKHRRREKVDDITLNSHNNCCQIPKFSKLTGLGALMAEIGLVGVPMVVGWPGYCTGIRLLDPIRCSENCRSIG